MSYRLGGGIGGLWLSLTLGLGIGLLLARQAATPAAVRLLLPDTTCPAPCWQGINTNELDHETTIERIMDLPQVENQGLLKWQFGGGHRLRLENGREVVISPQGIRLGDILVAWGWADYQVKGSGFDTVSGQGFDFIRLYYVDESWLVTVIVPYGERLTPAARVRQLQYLATPITPPEARHDWQGFIWLDEHYPYFGYVPSISLN